MALRFEPNSVHSRKTSLSAASDLGLGTLVPQPKRAGRLGAITSMSAADPALLVWRIRRPRVALSIGLRWRLPPARAITLSRIGPESGNRGDDASFTAKRANFLYT